MNKKSLETLTAAAPNTVKNIQNNAYISKLPPPNPQLSKKAQQVQIEAYEKDVLDLRKKFIADATIELDIAESARLPYAIEFAEQYAPKNNLLAFLEIINDLKPLITVPFIVE